MDRFIDALVRIWELVGALSPALILYLIYRVGCLQRKLQVLEHRIAECEAQSDAG